MGKADIPPHGDRQGRNRSCRYNSGRGGRNRKPERRRKPLLFSRLASARLSTLAGAGRSIRHPTSTIEPRQAPAPRFEPLSRNHEPFVAAACANDRQVTN
jgi:hypothetical protein